MPSGQRTNKPVKKIKMLHPSRFAALLILLGTATTYVACKSPFGPPSIEGHITIELASDRHFVAPGDTAWLEVTLTSNRNRTLTLDFVAGDVSTCAWNILVSKWDGGRYPENVWSIRPLGSTTECHPPDPSTIVLAPHESIILGRLPWSGKILSEAADWTAVRLEAGTYQMLAVVPQHYVEVNGEEYFARTMVGSDPPLRIEIIDGGTRR